MKKLLLLTIISSTFLFIACSKKSSNVSHTVKYTISSTSAMNVSYTDADGTLKFVSNVTSTWTYSLNTPGNGSTFQLLIISTNGSAVSGAIYVDGQVATQSSSNTGSLNLSTQVP